MISPAKKNQTWIKICGITSVQLAETAVQAGADAIGVVFAEKSPRLIDMDLAQQIVNALPETVTPVGLFQNPSLEGISGSRGWNLPWIQLHGDEDEAFIKRIEDHHIIKGFQFEPDKVSRWNVFPGVDVLLIDGTSGGGGESFPHEQLAEMMSEIETPVVLAGGLTPDNVAEAIRIIKPFGVDVSSGVESSRGVKDAGMIREFCAAVRQEDGE